METSALTETYEKFQVGRIAYIGFVYAFGSSKKTSADSFDYDQP